MTNGYFSPCYFYEGFFTLVHRQLVAEKKYFRPIVAIFYISEARMLKRQMQMQFLLLPAFFSFAIFWFYLFAFISPRFFEFQRCAHRTCTTINEVPRDPDHPRTMAFTSSRHVLAYRMHCT